GGQARLGDWAVSCTDLVGSPADRRQADLAASAALIARLRKASGRPAGGLTPEAECLARLERQLSTRADQDDRGGLVEAAVRVVGGGAPRGEVGDELAALVTALQGGDRAHNVAVGGGGQPGAEGPTPPPHEDAALRPLQPDTVASETAPLRRVSV